MHGVDKPMVIARLREWGFWLRSARSPGQDYTLSRMDSPLTKKRTVKPVYRSESAENLDLIMSFHMDKDAIHVLELYYAKQVPASSGAAAMNCSIRTYTAKRYEAQSILIGVLSAINSHQLPKIA